MALLAWACDSFSEGDPPSDVDSGMSADGPISGDEGLPAGDGGGGSGGDGGDATTILGTLAPNCPRPAAPTCSPLSECENRILYKPPVPGIEFPFGIATDSEYVYWVTSSIETAGDLPYDGMGTARIMRVARSGVLAGAQASLIATGQRRAVAIAMAGDYVYWGAMAGVNAKLRRVRRDCSANCVVEDLDGVPLGGSPIIEMTAIDDQTLVLADGNGLITVVKTTQALTLVHGTTSTSDYPAIAATSAECFVAGGDITAVTRIPGGAAFMAVKFGSIPDSGSGLRIGVSSMTTDCKDIYGWRGANNVWKVRGDGGTAVAFTAEAGVPAAFEMAADQGYLYLAVPDGPGVFAVSIANAKSQQVAGGNVHRLAVDDKGIYYGDHERTTGGAIRMIVK